RLLGRERPVPGGPDRFALELRDHPAVAVTPPPVVVAEEHRVGEHLLDRLARPVRGPPPRLLHHLWKEGHGVLRPGTGGHAGTLSRPSSRRNGTLVSTTRSSYRKSRLMNRAFWLCSGSCHQCETITSGTITFTTTFGCEEKRRTSSSIGRV